MRNGFDAEVVRRGDAEAWGDFAQGGNGGLTEGWKLRPLFNL